MSDVATLVERARADIERIEAGTWIAPVEYLLNDLADALSAVTAERDRYEEALKEIADGYEPGDIHTRGVSHVPEWYATLAGAALAGPEGDGT